MKRMQAALLALLLLMGMSAAHAEDGEFVIGVTTRLSGAFYTNMWGNNTADIDVRTLLHGYSPVVWTEQAQFSIDSTVVKRHDTAVLSNGNKVYTVEIAEGLRYSDGSPITAQDYALTYMLHASPVIRALGGITTNSSHIAGYAPYFAGETNVFSGIRILSPRVFSVEINAAFLPFFFELSMIDAIPSPISVIAPGCEVVDTGHGVTIQNIDKSVLEPLFTEALLAQTLLDDAHGYLTYPSVTSGPYTLHSFDKQTREATFRINPHYKGNHEGKRPTIDNLRLVPVVPDAMLEAFERGDVHLLNKVVAKQNIDEGLKVVSAGRANAALYPRLGFGFVSFSCEAGPTQFEAVRQAIAHTIDIDAFREQFVGSHGSPVYGYYGMGQWMVQAIEKSALPGLTKAEQSELSAMSLSSIKRYTKNVERAKQLLIADGWVLGASGEPFVEGRDVVRHKLHEGALMPLSLSFAQMQDSIAAQMVVDAIAEPLARIGASLEVTVLPFEVLLDEYYQKPGRTFDMMYLATNFISIFDPFFVFNTEDAFQGTQNTTGFRDDMLESLAHDLRRTEPGAYLAYCRKWLAFQTAYAERIPMLPLYTNMYYDFFTPRLTNYKPDAQMNWPHALLYATLAK